MSKMIHAAHAVIVLIASVAISGCLLGPDYVRPKSNLPEEFENAAPAGAAGDQVLAEYWAIFDDAVLDQLIRAALSANHDLRIAKARLAETRAARRTAIFDLWPTVTAKAGRQRSHLAPVEAQGAPADALNSDYREAGFDASWEISLFGRGTRGISAQNAFLRRSKAEAWGTQVAITGEVTRQYFEYRGLQMRLDVAMRNAANQTESLRITEARIDVGRGTELDRARAQAQLELTLATVPRLQTALARASYRMAVLTGQNPANDLVPDQEKTLVELPVLVPVGNPVDMMRRRPDIIAAEQNLEAQTYLIGYRKTELFPRITFGGNAGFAAQSSGDLGESNTKSWRFAPSISWAAFDLGRVLTNVKIQRARTEVALAEYEKSILLALEDVEGALAEYNRSAEIRDHLERAVKASAEASRLAHIRFDNGISDFTTVLDVEAQQLQAEDQLAQAHTQSASALIAVFKALGGGWTMPVSEASPN